MLRTSVPEAAINKHRDFGAELRLIAIMRAARITGWRSNSKLLGKPDFVFRLRIRTAFATST